MIAVTLIYLKTDTADTPCEVPAISIRLKESGGLNVNGKLTVYHDTNNPLLQMS